MNDVLTSRANRAYLLLTSLVICGMVGSMLTVQKIVHIGVDFPFGSLIVSSMTYPIIDCICELWGKPAARQTLVFALLTQLILIFIFSLSIAAPGAAVWQHQAEFSSILSSGYRVVAASFAAFAVAQLFDIVVFQNIKRITKGKWLWLRTNISVYLGQAVDTIIFVNIVFADLAHKWVLMGDMILLKIIMSFLMTPFVYLIVYVVNWYLDDQTLAFEYVT